MWRRYSHRDEGHTVPRDVERPFGEPVQYRQDHCGTEQEEVVLVTYQFTIVVGKRGLMHGKKH